MADFEQVNTGWNWADFKKEKKKSVLFAQPFWDTVKVWSGYS